MKKHSLLKCKRRWRGNSSLNTLHICVYSSLAGIKLAVCVRMLEVVISPYTGRQLDKMPMDTRKMATTLLHFTFWGLCTTHTLYVKKSLAPYSGVQGVKWLPCPQAGQLFKATGIFYLLLSACKVLSRSSGQHFISICLSDRHTFLSPLLLLFLLFWQLNGARSFLFCLFSGWWRKSGSALLLLAQTLKISKYIYIKEQVIMYYMVHMYYLPI